MEQDELEGFTRTVWNHTQLAEGLFLSRGHLYRLLEAGQILPPDTVIASDRFGWDPQRARRFGIETDRMDADGRPIGPPPEGSLSKSVVLAKGRYNVAPRVYLSTWLCSYVYGLQQQAVYFMRKRRGFIPADVKIEPKAYGWSEERVIEFGEQTGRLDDAGIDRWLLRRTAEFGLSPDIEWVRKRLAERPALNDRLGEALEQWREGQRKEEPEKPAQGDKSK